MTTKLEELLASIDPDNTSEITFRRANEALNTFPTGALIDRWEGFKHCMAGFLVHLEAHILRLNEPVSGSRDFCWARCVQHLHGTYGPNGEKAAFEMARTGNDGGLYAVLKALAMRIADEYSRNEVRARIGFYWQGLSVRQRLEASSEFLDKYGHLLPSELTEGNAARIRADLPKALENYHDLLAKMRRVGR